MQFLTALPLDLPPAVASGQVFVIRCEPDPFTGERINVGVCVQDASGKRHVRCIEEPGRLADTIAAHDNGCNGASASHIMTGDTLGGIQNLEAGGWTATLPAISQDRAAPRFRGSSKKEGSWSISANARPASS